MTDFIHNLLKMNVKEIPLLFPLTELQTYDNMSRSENIQQLADWITKNCLDFIINIMRAIVYPNGSHHEQKYYGGSLDFVVESVKNAKVFMKDAAWDELFFTLHALTVTVNPFSEQSFFYNIEDVTGLFTDKENMKALGDLVIESGNNLVEITKNKIENSFSNFQISLGLKSPE